jgi:polar amino acid transport system ATP-binding protein
MACGLTLSGVSKRFGAVPALRSVSLDALPGQVISVIGPSGSGKSTLLRCIGLHRIDEGQINLGSDMVVTPQSSEQEIGRLRNSVGHIFQDFHLWPHKTVLENLTLAPTMVKGVEKGAATAKALAILGRLGLSSKAGCYPDALSGGRSSALRLVAHLPWSQRFC